MIKLTVNIADEITHQPETAGDDLSRHALKALTLEEYKSGHIIKAELRRMLGVKTSGKLELPDLSENA